MCMLLLISRIWDPDADLTRSYPLNYLPDLQQLLNVQHGTDAAYDVGV